MSEAIIITPVKDSLETTKLTIRAISQAKGNFSYYVFNDFSGQETTDYLTRSQTELNFKLVNVGDFTNTPSPNYKLVLQKAQQLALSQNCPLIIIESDVVIKENTITELLRVLKSAKNPGIIGAITIDKSGNYNFPYNFEKEKEAITKKTNHSLSFCCTLLSVDFLKEFSFEELSQKKDWYDVFISRQSKKLGFNNYLSKDLEVLHMPHSSRPWKNLKYTNPVKYYLKKFFLKRDRI